MLILLLMFLNELLICQKACPLEEVKAYFKRINTESSVFMCNLSNRVCKINDQERLDRSQNQDRDVFETHTRFKAAE